MKDCVFVVADRNMEATFRGFFERPALQQVLQFRSFTYDIIPEPTHDPGVYTKAHELLRVYQRTHRFAVVVLDEAWDGSPGAVTIRRDILENLMRTGWHEERIAVVVIVPELEAWILQDRQPFYQAMRFSHPSVRDWLASTGHWRAGEPKSHAPKEAIEAICRSTRVPRSGVLYRQIARQISFHGCTDENFRSLCDQLRTWFPLEDAQ